MNLVFNPTELYILQEITNESPTQELSDVAELEKIETTLTEYCKNNPDNCTDAQALLEKVTGFLAITE